jgi:hypothetical protein
MLCNYFCCRNQIIAIKRIVMTQQALSNDANPPRDKGKIYFFTCPADPTLETFSTTIPASTSQGRWAIDYNYYSLQKLAQTPSGQKLVFEGASDGQAFTAPQKKSAGAKPMAAPAPQPSAASSLSPSSARGLSRSSSPAFAKGGPTQPAPAQQPAPAIDYELDLDLTG